MAEQVGIVQDQPLVPSLGSVWETSSLLWGRPAGAGDWLDQRSTLNGALLQRSRLLSQVELDQLLHGSAATPLPQDELWRFVARLERALQRLTPMLFESLQHETGFVARDCQELIDGSLAYVREFPQMIAQLSAEPPAPLAYQLPGATREIRLSRVAWGTIAIILPQNAFLIIALTALLNALATGNRIILRAPQQSARTAALLALALQHAAVPASLVSVVLAGARPLIEAVWRAPQPMLLHYMGSSQHAAQLAADALRFSKPALIDGSGNSWVWIDADVELEHAVELLTAGALRYNGQTCTSINGALIHPALYPALAERLAVRWHRLRAGNPAAADVDVGPLFDAQQAAWCEQLINQSGGRIICGGSRSGNLLAPTLVAEPQPDSALVREGLFGPGLWIAPGDHQQFVALWPHNRYPLCAGVLSASAEPAAWAAALPNVARLVLNGDPSVEYIFEPWGGYPASGSNSVGVWHEKYQRVVAIDAPASGQPRQPRAG